MKIMQLIPILTGGGAERLVIDLSNELSKQNEISFVTLYNPDQKDLFRKDIYPSIRTYSLNKRPGFDPRVIFRLFKVIRAIRPDVIHSHLRSFDYLIPLLPFLRGIPIVHTIHSDAFNECPNYLIRKCRALIFKRQSVHVVAISKKSAQSVADAYGDIGCNIIPNGRRYPAITKKYEQVKEQVESYKSQKSTKVFVHIGSFKPAKNQCMLVEAFEQMVTETKADAVLIIIGGTRNTAISRDIHQYLRQAEQKHDFIFLVDETFNATDYLHAGDFFCLSSKIEGMPITLIEAMAAGCIPVCTPVGGIPEMLKELNTSLLSKGIEAEDYKQLLEEVNCFNNKQKDRLKKKGRRLFDEKYSIETCSNRYFKLFMKINSA